MAVEHTFNEDNPYGSSSTIIEGTPLNPDTANDPVVKGTTTKFVAAPMDTPAAADPAADAAAAQKAATDKALIDAAAAQTAVADKPSDAPALAPVTGTPMPTGGADKFFNKDTGTYNWEAHAREADFRIAQKAPRAAAPVKAANIADAAQKAAADAGLNWETLGQTLAQNGTLTEADYTALAGSGIPRDIVDNYVTALTSVGTLAREAAENYIGGGKDATANAVATDALMDWAGKNLSDAEVTEHDRILMTSNWRISVDALLTARANALGPQAAEPQPATVFRGDNAVAPATGEGAFKDFAEQVKAQQDPRYSKDEDFRQAVIRRIGMGG